MAIEDKNLYKIQKETKVSVSYSTGKLAASSSIHPKQTKFKTLQEWLSTKKKTHQILSIQLNPVLKVVVGWGQSWGNRIFKKSKKINKYQRTEYASKLVTSLNLSTHKSTDVCKKLLKEEINIPIPSQSTFKSVFKEVEKLVKKFKKFPENLVNSL